MRRPVIALIVVILVIIAGALLFSRWWRGRLASSISLVSPAPTFTTVSPTFTPNPSTTSMLRQLRTLPNEKVVDMSPADASNAAGAVRYGVVNNQVSFTIVVSQADTPNLTAWLVSSSNEVKLGSLTEAKGGWLLDGQAQTSVFPAMIIITRNGKNIRETNAQVLQATITL